MFEMWYRLIRWENRPKITCFSCESIENVLRDRICWRLNDMLVTLAVIGGLAIIVVFIRALGLKRISVEFDGNRQLFRRNDQLEDEKAPKQLNK
jgi:hypothetical protein